MPSAPIVINSPVAGTTFNLRRLSGREALGRLYQVELELLCDDDRVNLDDLLGQPMSVGFEQHGTELRYFHGHAVRFAHAGMEDRRSIYQATLLPWLWFLSRTADCRIFQFMTAPDIIQQVFRELGFTDFELKLSGTYRLREYCVQYRETDFNFVSRLMEEEGIYYYFVHEASKHTLVMTDSLGGHTPVPQYEKVRYLPVAASGRKEDAIFNWSVARKVRTGAFALTDYDFEKPLANLLTAGAESRNHPHASLEVFDYPGDYRVIGDGEAYTKMRLEAEQSEFEQTVGRGNARGLFAGGLFTLADFPREDQNREYLIVAAEHELIVPEGEVASAGGTGIYSGRVTSIPSSLPFRPAQETRKAIVQGPQTAVVVGPAGEEIWTDKYGRVKVQFPWDRYGKKDENSSCWVRVAQVWAGKNWGGIEIPRIGQEVIVEFLEGDPDNPIITGRVYNADQMPPYALPANMTQSGMKTRSTKSGNTTTFNELRFEDLKDSEQVYFHAEKNFDRVVENNDTLKVGFDKKDKGDQTVEIFNNQTVSVGTSGCEVGDQATTVYNNQKLTVGVAGCADGSQTITVLTNRTETVKEGDETVTIETGNRTINVDTGNDEHNVKTGDRTVNVDTGNDEHNVKTGDRTVNVDTGSDTHNVKTGDRTVNVDSGNDSITVGSGDRTVTVSSGKCTIEAGSSIELKVGGSSIKIDSTSITLKALKITVKATAKAEMKGAITKVSGSGQLTLKGGIVQIN